MKFASDEQRRAVFARMRAPSHLSAMASTGLGVGALRYAKVAQRFDIKATKLLDQNFVFPSTMRAALKLRNTASKNRKIAAALGVGSLLAAGNAYRTRNR